MKTLIAEDDFTSRLLLQEILGVYGPVHIAVNGQEALEAVHGALEDHQPYNLICMDIMMPGMDGQTALKEIRSMEEAKGIYFSKGVKIIMTSALDGLRSKIDAFSELCDDYMTKPIHKERLLKELQTLGLISKT
jgi:two-component system chemotaxis response regulator CheY